MNAKITVLSFSPSGKFYLEHIIEVPASMQHRAVCNYIKSHREQFPVGKNLLVLKSDKQTGFVPHLIISKERGRP